MSVNELVFILFFFKYQNHFDMKKSPCKNSGNSWGVGWGVQIKESSLAEVWIFSGTTHSQNMVGLFR